MATQHEDEEKQQAQWQQDITCKQQLAVTQEDKAAFQVTCRREQDTKNIRACARLPLDNPLSE
jgi:hypothetical protein